jgi:hypothetical protein
MAACPCCARTGGCSIEGRKDHRSPVGDLRQRTDRHLSTIQDPGHGPRDRCHVAAVLDQRAGDDPFPDHLEGSGERP